MITLCDFALVKPQSMIYKNYIIACEFPEIWKKSNTSIINYKNDKQTINNHRSISLLRICGKLLETIIFNSTVNHLDNNKFLSAHQSGFRENDSCVNQLIAIFHEI